MPSKNPRIALTVPEDLNNILDELSNIQGKPKTKIITELLIEIKPVLELMLCAFKDIESNKSKALDVVKKFGDDSVLLATKKTSDLAVDVSDFKSKCDGYNE